MHLPQAVWCRFCIQYHQQRRYFSRFISATYSTDELKTFLNRTPEDLAGYCMTVLFAAWHFSLIYCFIFVIGIKAHLSFMGVGSETDALIHFEEHPTLQVFTLIFKDLQFNLQSRWL